MEVIHNLTQPPIPTRASKAHIYAFAEHVAAQLGFRPGDSLESLVARLGGKIEYHHSSPMGGRTGESIVVRNMRDFTIYVPTTTSPQRDRFTIAHELGHLFLHFQMVQKAYPGAVMSATRWVDAADPVQQRAEWEANWFAAAFLMPAGKFREELSKHVDLQVVATMFGVSTQAAAVRAKSLELHPAY